MAHVVRWVTTERGLDAADFALVAYGGAGPLHASAVARELSIGTVIIPRAPGHFSAYGMLVADLRRDFVNTWFTPLADASFPEMEEIFAEMERQGRDTVGRGQTLVGRRGASAPPTCATSARSTPSPSICRSSCSRRRTATASRRCSMPCTRRATASRSPARRPRSSACAAPSSARCESPPFEHIAKGGAEPDAAAFRGKRPVYFASTGFVDTPTYDRPALKAGNKITGPALIEEHASTTVAHPGDLIEVDAFGDLVITVRRG